MAKTKKTTKHHQKGLLAMFQSFRRNPRQFSKQALQSKVGLIGFVGLFAAVGVIALVLTRAETPSTQLSITGPPTVPPAQICGNGSVLNGPTTQPKGSILVKAEDNAAFFEKESFRHAEGAGVVYWFEPGIHTFGTSEFGQIIPNENTTYIGAPGAILDGRNMNRFAFTGQSSGVTIKNLTIQNFGQPPFFDSTLGTWRGGNQNEAVVNTGAAPNWTVQNNTITHNHGVGLFTGDNIKASYNCIDANGQHGFGGYRPPVAGKSSINNVTLDHNEISNNNTDDWEAKQGGCGCTGGGKFWDTSGGIVTNNWVHDNKSVGLWADTNNIDFVFEGNYINNNDDEGLFYEISYNAVIRHNTFKRNAIKKGQTFASQNNGTPAAAIYISESGGESRVSSTTTGTTQLDIGSNYFEDNWDGVSLFESANRFCGNPANPETGGAARSGYCTKVNQGATFTTCNDPAAGGSINVEPYYSDCRHKTQNVLVHDNEFHFNAANLGNCNPNFCGRMAQYSDVGTTTGGTPAWNPYIGNVIKDAVTFKQNNKWANNHYFGNWKFGGYDSFLEFGGWLAAPYNQDIGSTTDVMSRLNNHLDNDTSNLEGSAGHWSAWYSSTVSRSTASAQSGSASLKVDVTSGPNWGVSLNNWPGLAASPGNKTISFWGISGAGNHNATLRVKWRDSNNADIQTDSIAIASLSSAWQQPTKDVVAPAGTVKVFVELFGTNGATGNFAYFDNFFVGDKSSTTSPPTDTTNPTVSVTAPAANATLTATTTLAATASDTVGVTKVEFYEGPSKLGEDTSSPYSYAWDTATVTNGSHSLTAKAYDAANNSATSAPVPVTVSNTPPDTTPPTPPTSLTATTASATSVNLKWTAATDNVGVTKYYVVRGGVTIAELASTSLNYSDTGLSPSTKYDYYVLASDAAGNVSPASNTASVTTPAQADTTPPSTPTNLTGTAATPTQVNLSWTASTDNVGVTGYRVYRNDKGLNAIATVTGTSFGDSTASASTTYSYYLTAIDAAGNSSQFSNTVSVTTPAPVPPAANGNISGVVTGQNNALLAGATVKVTFGGVNHSYSTNSSGSYVVTNIPAGSYTLTYSAKRYRSQTANVTVTASTTVTKNITLQKR